MAVADSPARRRKHARRRVAAVVLLLLAVVVVLVVVLFRVEAPRSDRRADLKELCDRGEALHTAKLLDEAAAVFARGEREKASCADELDQIEREQETRSDAIENARVERLIASRRPAADAGPNR